MLENQIASLTAHSSTLLESFILIGHQKINTFSSLSLNKDPQVHMEPGLPPTTPSMLSKAQDQFSPFFFFWSVMKRYYFCYVGIVLLVILKLEYPGIDPWAYCTNINNNRKMAYSDDSCKWVYYTYTGSNLCILRAPILSIFFLFPDFCLLRSHLDDYAYCRARGMVYKLRGVVFTTTGMMQRATTVSFKFNSKLFLGEASACIYWISC